MVTGGYSVQFRTGSESGTDLEILLNAINQSRGSAMNCQPGTVVWVENMAIARILYLASETVRRYSLQMNPSTMSSFLPRWEKILGITPSPDASDNDRRAAVGAKFQIIGLTQTTQTVQDYLTQLIGTYFQEIIRVNSSVADTAVPGGLVIAGGLTIPDGDWHSNISSLLIRVTQPLFASDQEFYTNVDNFKQFMYDFLPAYVTFDWGRFGQQLNGTISLTAGSVNVVGSGTLFLTDPGGAIQPGEEIEVFDDNNNLRTLTVLSIQTDTTLTVTLPISINITNKIYSRFGFYLDASNNLDNSFLT